MRRIRRRQSVVSLLKMLCSDFSIVAERSVEEESNVSVRIGPNICGHASMQALLWPILEGKWPGKRHKFSLWLCQRNGICSTNGYDKF